MSLSAITSRPATATAAIDAMLSKARTAYFTTFNPSAAAVQSSRRANKRPVAAPRHHFATLGGEPICCTSAADAEGITLADCLLEGSTKVDDVAAWDRLVGLLQRHGRHRAARLLAERRDNQFPVWPTASQHK